MQIQKITKTDFEELFKLIQEFAAFEKLPHKMVNSVEKMKMEQGYILGFTVRDEHNKLIGYVTYFYAYYTWTGKSIYMDDLYVCQEYRGKKIGTTLINKVIEIAKQENCHQVRWQVSNWNHPAIAFYKSLGAEINEVERNCDLILP